MYPNLYFFLKEVFGVEIQFFKLINTFGFLVALAFLSAAWALTTELKRRQQAGWLGFTETQITVGDGAPMSDIIWNAFFGFIIGFKFIDEIAEEAEVFIAVGEELFEVEREFQLKSVVGGCEAEDAEDGDYRPASDGGK